MWEEVHTDLYKILEMLRGTAKEKLEKKGEAIYSCGAERFGVVEREKTTPTIPTKSRR